MKPALLLLMLTVLTGAAVDEPVHHGRKLSAWLNDFHNSGLRMHVVQPGVRERSEVAAVALLEMGTNVIPELVRVLRADVLGKKTDSLPPHRAGDSGEQAAYALALFGEKALPQVPALVELLPEKSAAQTLSVAFAGIGPGTLPALSRALTNSDSRLHYGAVCAIRHQAMIAARGLPVTNALPALLVALNDSDGEVCRLVVETLGYYVRQQPERVVPAVKLQLANTGAKVRAQALNTLMRLYREQDPEVLLTTMRPFMNDPDARVRQCAEVHVRNLEKWLAGRP